MSPGPPGGCAFYRINELRFRIGTGADFSSADNRGRPNTRQSGGAVAIDDPDEVEYREPAVYRELLKSALPAIAVSGKTVEQDLKLR